MRPEGIRCVPGGQRVSGVRGHWVLVFICGVATVWALWAGQGLSRSSAGEPVPGPAFVEILDETGEATVVALPPGFLSWLDGRSFRRGPRGRWQAAWMAGERLVALGIPVPINEVAASDLAAIPGVSRRVALAIVEARASEGAFLSWEALDAVSGVGVRTLETLRRMGRLGPVDPGGRPP